MVILGYGGDFHFFEELSCGFNFFIRYDRVNLFWGWGRSPPARLSRARYAATPSAGLCPATPRPRPHVSRFRVGCLHVRYDKPRPNTKGPSLTGARNAQEESGRAACSLRISVGVGGTLSPREKKLKKEFDVWV